MCSWIWTCHYLAVAFILTDLTALTCHLTHKMHKMFIVYIHCIHPFSCVHHTEGKGCGLGSHSDSGAVAIARSILQHWDTDAGFLTPLSVPGELHQCYGMTCWCCHADKKAGWGTILWLARSWSTWCWHAPPANMLALATSSWRLYFSPLSSQYTLYV